MSDVDDDIEMGVDFDVDMPDVPEAVEQKDVEIHDEREGAFKLAFIGSGQGGSRIAQSFYDLGYRKVCAINTTNQDMASIKLPEKNKMLISEGGAGKQPAVANELFRQKKEDVLDFMRRSFGPVLDRVIVTVGAGGGTGAGTVNPLIDTARELQIALKCPTEKVGAIVALPKKMEGHKVHENAYYVLESLLQKVKEGIVSPLIVLDNERIETIFQGLPVGKFWNTANGQIAALLNLFNTISAKDSSYITFDKNDFATIMDSGMIVFGATPVKDWQDPTGISKAVRVNLTRNILSGGVDLSTGKVAGCVVIGGNEVFDELPQANVDHAFEQLTRLLEPGSTVHQGQYTGKKQNLVVYTAIGGLERPEEKLKELNEAGKVGLPYKKGVGVILGEI